MKITKLFNLQILIWVITFLVLSTIVAQAFKSFQSVRREISHQFNKQQLLLAKQAAVAVEDFVAGIEKTMVLLSKLKSINDVSGVVDSKRRI